MRYDVLGVIFFVLWLFAGAAHGQVVVIGPDGKSGPPPGDAGYCASVEPLQPNLVLKVDTTVRGRISDQSGAPFSVSPIELRRFISAAKQQRVKKVLTGDDGK